MFNPVTIMSGKQHRRDSDVSEVRQRPTEALHGLQQTHTHTHTHTLLFMELLLNDANVCELVFVLEFAVLST